MLNTQVFRRFPVLSKCNLHNQKSTWALSPGAVWIISKRFLSYFLLKQHNLLLCYNLFSHPVLKVLHVFVKHLTSVLGS